MKVGTSRSEAITVSRFITSFWSFEILAWKIVAHAGDEVARGLEAFRGPQQLVVGVGEMDLDVAREDLDALELDSRVDDHAHRVARGRQRAADAQQVVAERRDPFADLRGRPLLDVILELVDLVVQVVDQVEVALGDLVDEAEREHADVLLRPACLLGRLRVERLLVGRRLRDRHELVGGQDEVDLLVEDAVLGGHRDGDQEDADDVGAVGLDPWARLVVVDGRREQKLERGRVQAFRNARADLVRRRVDQVDPAHRLGHGSRLDAASAGLVV